MRLLSSSADEEVSSGSGVTDTEHTASCPYCGDLTCWCHTFVDYHEQVTCLASGSADPEEVAQAFSFFGIG